MGPSKSFQMNKQVQQQRQEKTLGRHLKGSAPFAELISGKAQDSKEYYQSNTNDNKFNQVQQTQQQSQSQSQTRVLPDSYKDWDHFEQKHANTLDQKHQELQDKAKFSGNYRRSQDLNDDMKQNIQHHNIVECGNTGDEMSKANAVPRSMRSSVQYSLSQSLNQEENQIQSQKRVESPTSRSQVKRGDGSSGVANKIGDMINMPNNNNNGANFRSQNLLNKSQSLTNIALNKDFYHQDNEQRANGDYDKLRENMNKKRYFTQEANYDLSKRNPNNSIDIKDPRFDAGYTNQGKHGKRAADGSANNSCDLKVVNDHIRRASFEHEIKPYSRPYNMYQGTRPGGNYWDQSKNSDYKDMEQQHDSRTQQYGDNYRPHQFPNTNCPGFDRYLFKPPLSDFDATGAPNSRKSSRNASPRSPIDGTPYGNMKNRPKGGESPIVPERGQYYGETEGKKYPQGLAAGGKYGVTVKTGSGQRNSSVPANLNVQQYQTDSRNYREEPLKYLGSNNKNTTTGNTSDESKSFDNTNTLLVDGKIGNTSHFRPHPRKLNENSPHNMSRMAGVNGLQLAQGTKLTLAREEQEDEEKLSIYKVSHNELASEEHAHELPSGESQKKNSNYNYKSKPPMLPNGLDKNNKPDVRDRPYSRLLMMDKEGNYNDDVDESNSDRLNRNSIKDNTYLQQYNKKIYSNVRSASAPPKKDVEGNESQSQAAAVMCHEYIDDYENDHPNISKAKQSSSPTDLNLQKPGYHGGQFWRKNLQEHVQQKPHHKQILPDHDRQLSPYNNRSHAQGSTHCKNKRLEQHFNSDEVFNKSYETHEVEREVQRWKEGQSQWKEGQSQSQSQTLKSPRSEGLCKQAARGHPATIDKGMKKLWKHEVRQSSSNCINNENENIRQSQNGNQCPSEYQSDELGKRRISSTPPNKSKDYKLANIIGRSEDTVQFIRGVEREAGEIKRHRELIENNLNSNNNQKNLNTSEKQGSGNDDDQDDNVSEISNIGYNSTDQRLERLRRQKQRDEIFESNLVRFKRADEVKNKGNNYLRNGNWDFNGEISQCSAEYWHERLPERAKEANNDQGSFDITESGRIADIMSSNCAYDKSTTNDITASTATNNNNITRSSNFRKSAYLNNYSDLNNLMNYTNCNDTVAQRAAKQKSGSHFSDPGAIGPRKYDFRTHLDSQYIRRSGPPNEGYEAEVNTVQALSCPSNVIRNGSNSPDFHENNHRLMRQKNTLSRSESVPAGGSKLNYCRELLPYDNHPLNHMGPVKTKKIDDKEEEGSHNTNARVSNTYKESDFNLNNQNGAANASINIRLNQKPPKLPPTSTKKEVCKQHISKDQNHVAGKITNEVEQKQGPKTKVGTAEYSQVIPQSPRRLNEWFDKKQQLNAENSSKQLCYQNINAQSDTCEHEKAMKYATSRSSVGIQASEKKSQNLRGSVNQLISFNTNTAAKFNANGQTYVGPRVSKFNKTTNTASGTNLFKKWIEDDENDNISPKVGFSVINNINNHDVVSAVDWDPDAVESEFNTYTYNRKKMGRNTLTSSGPFGDYFGKKNYHQNQNQNQMPVAGVSTLKNSPDSGDPRNKSSGVDLRKSLSMSNLVGQQGQSQKSSIKTQRNLNYHHASINENPLVTDYVRENHQQEQEVTVQRTANPRENDEYLVCGKLPSKNLKDKMIPIKIGRNSEGANNVANDSNDSLTAIKRHKDEAESRRFGYGEHPRQKSLKEIEMGWVRRQKEEVNQRSLLAAGEDCRKSRMF